MGRPKLSRAQADRVRELRAQGWKLEVIALEMGCNIATVHKAVHGRHPYEVGA